MERLTERFSNGKAAVYGCGSNCKYDYKYCENHLEDCPTISEIYEKLAEYEDLEEQERLLKLPCAVGDTVYTNHSVQGWYFRRKDLPYKAEVVHIEISNGVNDYINIDFGNGHMLQFKFSDIGKTVFLTKSEAEQELKEMEEKANEGYHTV